MKKKSVAIIGVYPPPYGGISVHIERLAHTLSEQQIDYTVYSESEKVDTKADVSFINNVERWCLKYLFTSKEDIIHNHFLRWQVRFILSLQRLKGKKVVHSFHSLRDNNYSLPHRIMIYLTGLFSNNFIVVNEEIKDKLIKLKIPARKIDVIPAFIPPIEDENVEIPKYVEDIFNSSKTVILANGGIGNLHEGKELYGVDLCIEMFDKIAKLRDDATFVYCITHIGDEKIANSYYEKVKELGLEGRFHFIYEKMQLYPLMKQANIFVRPTRSDGDALSIREGLYYGINVVASDVVKRPSGAVLFKNGNGDDLAKKCIEILEANDSQNHEKAGAEQSQYVEQLLKYLS